MLTVSNNQYTEKQMVDAEKDVVHRCGALFFFVFAISDCAVSWVHVSQAGEQLRERGDVLEGSAATLR